VIGTGVYSEEEVSVRAHKAISESVWIRNDLTTIKKEENRWARFELDSKQRTSL
jgi:hypothetical protein